MECLKFQQLINDFIYDKIEYSDDLEEFLQHAKECKSCNEDLNLYYSIHRGLGDVDAPVESEEKEDVNKELENIKAFYEDFFTKQKSMKKAGRISIAVFLLVIIGTVLYIYFRVTGTI